MKAIALSSLLVLGGLGAPTLWADPPEKEDGAPAPAPQPAASPEQILAWVAELGSDDFRVREEASQKLAGAGEAAREALQSAVKTSDSLEVRWRAQQLLHRLDGRTEKRLDAPDVRPPAGPRVAPDQDDLRKLLEADTPEQLRELMDKLMQGMGAGGRPFGGPAIAPLEGFQMLGLTARHGGLSLRLMGFGRERVVLEVRGRDAAGMPSVATYQGENLEAILEANPALRDHPDLPGLKQDLERQKQQRQQLLRPGMGLFTFGVGEGIQITHDAQGVTVTLRERAADGSTKERVVKGESLEAIKREHPELADRLGGFHVQFGGGPTIFRGPRAVLPPPMPVSPPQVTPRVDDEPRFGLALEPVEGQLARHLKLETSGAVLVGHVVPGGQAETLGLKAMDIIVAIDAAPVLSMDDAVARLRAAAKAQGALRLDVVRQGQPLTLTR